MGGLGTREYDEDVIAFINLLKQNRFLYDIKAEDFKNTEKKYKLLDNFRKTLSKECSVQELLAKIKYFKRQVAKEKRSQDGRSADTLQEHIPWRWFSHCKFMIDAIINENAVESTNVFKRIPLPLIPIAVESPTSKRKIIEYKLSSSVPNLRAYKRIRMVTGSSDKNPPPQIKQEDVVVLDRMISPQPSTSGSTSMSDVCTSESRNVVAQDALVQPSLDSSSSETPQSTIVPTTWNDCFSESLESESEVDIKYNLEQNSLAQAVANENAWKDELIRSAQEHLEYNMRSCTPIQAIRLNALLQKSYIDFWREEK